MMRAALPAAAQTVDSPKIVNRGTVPVAERWQRWHDAMRHTDRDLRWYSVCVACRRNVFAFDDGENDPRGALGDNTLHAMTVEHDDGLPIIKSVEVRMCAICANDEEIYAATVSMVERALRSSSVAMAWERFGPPMWGMFELAISDRNKAPGIHWVSKHRRELS